jgi:hypothetical protein
MNCEQFVLLTRFYRFYYLRFSLLKSLLSICMCNFEFRYHSIAFLSMALAPMKTLANRLVLDVFVIIERAINGIVNL